MTKRQTFNKSHDLIKNARKEAFNKPLLNQYNIEICPHEKDIWCFYDRDKYAYFPLDLYFPEEQMWTKLQEKNLKLLNESNPSHKDNILIRDKKTKQVIGLFHGYQKGVSSYYMQTTLIHRDFRRKGIYSSLLDRILIYTKALGFCRVLSNHSPCNNPVLIAKLKKDFKIISLDVDGESGVNIWLCYFHNQELKQAFEFRCGHVTFSEKLYSASYGTAELLYKELKSAKKHSGKRKK